MRRYDIFFVSLPSFPFRPPLILSRNVKMLDEVKRAIIMKDGTRIPIEDVRMIKETPNKSLRPMPSLFPPVVVNPLST